LKRFSEQFLLQAEQEAHNQVSKLVYRNAHVLMFRPHSYLSAVQQHHYLNGGGCSVVLVQNCDLHKELSNLCLKIF
jgi:hypothetical protein